MLRSSLIYKFKSWGLLLLALLAISSCMPTTTPSIKNNAQTNGETSNSQDSIFSQPVFPHQQNFIQEGSTTTVNSLSLGLNFNDSFLIRGSILSTYLSKISSSTVMCVVGRYNYIPGQDRFLVMSARPMIYTDTIKKTQEYYLQVQPANDIGNQNDCLNFNMQSVLQTASSSLHFSLQQICVNCTTAVSSTPLKIYFATGEELSAVSLGATKIVISGSNQQTGNSCSSNSYCQGIGYNCCIESQCANNGAIRPSAYSLPGFLSAQEDVRLDPSRFRSYPEFYFICTDQTGTIPLPQPEVPDVDHEAAVRLKELKQLYDCLNLVEGEFSYCTVKFSDASKRANKTFSAAELNLSSDINFTAIHPQFKNTKFENNIVSIVYANESLYHLDSTTPLSGGTLSTANDNLVSTQSFSLTKPLSDNAKDDNLYLTYKVDGTCKKISSSLAQCHKSYIFDSPLTEKFKTNYHDNSSIFKLPLYADASPTATIKVEVSGIIVSEEAGNWSRGIVNELEDGVMVAKPRITFAPGYRLYQNQVIKVTYFVRSNVQQLLSMKELAQTKVNTVCQCSGISCQLKPIYSESNTSSIVNFDCTYPSEAEVVPVNQSVYVSNRNAPHRYFDLNGVNYDEGFENASAQEGIAFKYTNNNLLKPNNANCGSGDCYIGFNEIYGNFDTSGLQKSLPAKRIRVKKDTTYDLITLSGTFSTCSNCGTDYYNSLQKIFPSTFTQFGAGYTPDLLNSSQQNSTGSYRADDLRFGRACFVPVTMIPWTHQIKDSVREQRRSRLAAQHFLFANGYQKDWYGFDYGSLIGSFDGVSWFSVGSSRRIKAKGNYLYLAVNSYFHDLNTDNSYQLTVTEASSFSSPARPEHDLLSDGAQCQKNHLCSKDDDCYRQLGYDYTCQNINEINTEWPVFDQNGVETVNTLKTTLAAVIGGSQGKARRCVYRGRGTPCVNNLSGLLDEGNIFNGTQSRGHISCSNNNACTPLNANRFNNKVSRFANTPHAQNLQNVVSPAGDTVGLAAKILGRPFDYNGRSNIDATPLAALAQTKIEALCTPGVDISLANNTQELNQRFTPTPFGKSDKLFGVGPTLSGFANNWKYLSSCPATDESGYSVQQYDLGLTNPMLLTHTTTQNMSSNLLDIVPVINQGIFSSISTPFEDQQVTSVGYQRNACLRAPGASCFSDLECSPSSIMASKFKSATALSTYLNQAEINFWQEDLVCGNPNLKFLGNNILNEDFNILENRCCREIGKTITVSTQTDTSEFKWCEGNQIQVAGLNTTVNDRDRYSRVHTGYDSMTCNMGEISSNKKFALSVAKGSSPVGDLNQILAQYKTLDTINSRTCCTQNWVRSFHSSNGGGHNFNNVKTQRIDKSIFKYISWFPQDTTLAVSDGPFECHEDNFNNISCEIRSLTNLEQQTYLEWASTLELIGIPQVAIATNDKIYKIVNDAQNDIAAAREPLPRTIKDAFIEGADFSDGSNNFYSAANYSKFDMSAQGLKRVFSEDEFNCCLPSGNEVPDTVNDSQCCTGYVANNGGIRRCCLPDFTNLSVYLNRYVSSEGRGLPDHAYDEKTGYIKNPGTVVSIANQKSLCCSGTAMTGVAISKLPIPILTNRFLPPNSQNTVTRFNYRTDSVDNNSETGFIGDIFNAGVRWNNQVYCVPKDFNKN